MKLNILMICYYFPPLTDVGCKRSVAFAKYFQKHGWSPHVLSVKNPDRGYCSLGHDKPPDGVIAEYTYSIINLSRLVGKMNAALSRVLTCLKISLKINYVHQWICIPDIFWGWVPLTTLKALKRIRWRPTDVIYVSCSPVSAALCGVVLKLFTGKLLVLDFRDPFAVKMVFDVLGTPNLRRRIDSSIQNFFLRRADVFIVNNEETRQMYLEEVPHVQGKIAVVHNGFDESFRAQGKMKKHDKFTIIYTGDFYFYGIKSEVFFVAIAILKKRGLIDLDNFQFLFYGDGKEMIGELASKHGISDYVVANARVPYNIALEMIGRSHLQLLRIIKPMISTKLFEGISLNIPFLATIPHGEVEEIIHTYSRSSYVVAQDSGEEVANAIADAMIKYKTGQIFDNDVEGFLKKFSRENLTLKLMGIIENALLERGRA